MAAAARFRNIAETDAPRGARAIFDRAAVGFTVMSPELRYLEANNRFCEMLGYPREELLGMGLREVKRLIGEGVGGFKFHPTCQGFFPNDRMAYPMYEAMAEAKMPVIFHSGH